MTKVGDKIIVALDVPTKDRALELVEQLRGEIFAACQVLDAERVVIPAALATPPLIDRVRGHTLAAFRHRVPARISLADLDGAGKAGSDHDIDNTATADSNETSAVSDSETVALAYTPKIEIDKTFVNVTGGDGEMHETNRRAGRGAAGAGDAGDGDR